MNEKMQEEFINEYSGLYFTDTEKDSKELGISRSLNRTDREDENFIIQTYLECGEINSDVVAWKAGKYRGKSEIDWKWDGKNGYGGKIEEAELNAYMEYLREKTQIVSEAERGIDYLKDGKHREAIEEIQNAYKDMLGDKIVPDNIGPVYIINLLFFLTKGKAPIYDQYAHKAVRALGYDVSPALIYIGENPDKHSAKKVVEMYYEYLLLLKNVFGGDVFKPVENNDDRKLDQALWVYGHVTDVTKKF